MKGNDLVQSFRSLVQQESLLVGTEKLLVAVSGGVDSTTLAYLLREEGYDLVIAHCNYHLRGEASNLDEAVVKKLAERLNAPLAVGFIDMGLHAGNTQMVAREIRYKYFKKMLDEYNCDLLVTAHHLEDSFETLLINLTRGSGLAGIKGMPCKTEFPLVRPFLSATRKQILDYADARSIQWREDASNYTDDYARNRIRHHMLPMFYDQGLTDRGLRSTLSNLRSAESFYRIGLESSANRYFKRRGEGLVFDRAAASHLNQIDTITLLLYQTSELGFPEEVIRQMLTVEGSHVFQSAKYQARVSPETITFEPATSVADPQEIVIHHLPFSCTLMYGVVELSIVPRPDNFKDDDQYCRLTELPLLLRSRRPGDRFQPFGMTGRKKVKAMQIDAKVPVWERDQARILSSTQGEIMALIGHRIAAPYAIETTDQMVLRIRVTKENPGLP